MLTAESLRSSFQLNLDDLFRALEDLQRDPRGTVHDLRTSIRRVRAAYSIIPKSARKEIEGLDRFIGACVAAFNASSALRDAEILTAKLAHFMDYPEQRLSRLTASKAKDMEKKIRVLNLLEMPVVSFRLTDSDIQKRYRRRVDKLEDASRRLLAATLSDETRAEDLHSLRKAYKKLRYTLELESSESVKKRKRVKSLKKLQDILGAIHDSDITLAFLEENKRIRLSDNSFVASERAARHENYKAFVELCARHDNFL